MSRISARNCINAVLEIFSKMVCAVFVVKRWFFTHYQWYCVMLNAETWIILCYLSQHLTFQKNYLVAFFCFWKIITNINMNSADIFHTFALKKKMNSRSFLPSFYEVKSNINWNRLIKCNNFQYFFTNLF